MFDLQFAYLETQEDGRMIAHSVNRVVIDARSAQAMATALLQAATGVLQHIEQQLTTQKDALREEVYTPTSTDDAERALGLRSAKQS